MGRADACQQQLSHARRGANMPTDLREQLVGVAHASQVRLHLGFVRDPRPVKAERSALHRVSVVQVLKFLALVHRDFPSRVRLAAVKAASAATSAEV